MISLYHYDLKIQLKKYKAKLYAQLLDPLFMAAMAEKMQGREEKWNAYNEIRQQIYDITSIPTQPGGGLI